MRYWHEIIENYDNPSEEDKKRKDPKHLQSVVIILLMYLSMGKNYPYDIAKTFRSIVGLNISGIDLLSQANKLSSLLKRMKQAGLLIEVPDTTYIKKRTYYELNPALISSPIQDIENDEKSFRIPIDLIKIFLNWLARSNKNEEILSWTRIERFDFLTFIMFIKRKAIEWEDSWETTEPSIDAPKYQKFEKKMSKYLEEYMTELENVSGPTRLYRAVLKYAGSDTPAKFLRDTREPKDASK